MASTTTPDKPSNRCAASRNSHASTRPSSCLPTTRVRRNASLRTRRSNHHHPRAAQQRPGVIITAAVRALRTDDVSSRITQDVLLMAGAEDHYVPLTQLGAQIQTLTNARSVTARVFTRAESAQNHCQMGNLGLSLRVILGWLDEHTGAMGDPGL